MKDPRRYHVPTMRGLAISQAIAKGEARRKPYIFGKGVNLNANQRKRIKTKIRKIR